MKKSNDSSSTSRPPVKRVWARGAQWGVGQSPTDNAAGGPHQSKISVGVSPTPHQRPAAFGNPLLVVLLCSVFAIPAFAQEGPPQTVSTIAAHFSNWRDNLDVVGNVRASTGADLAAEIAGIVDRIEFTSGTEVKAGSELARLRLNDDPAKLDELNAAADLARANLARDEKQIKAFAVSQAVIDADKANLRGANARVAEQNALMDEKIIRAPFTGKLGLRQVDVGQYLPPGTVVVTLQALDPLFVDFYVPQQALGQMREGETISFAIDAYPGRAFQAPITAISPKVDQLSRMAQVRATYPNPDHALSPGMFANIAVGLGIPHQYITLPNAAVMYNTYGSAVYIVTPGRPYATVHQQLVTLGQTRGDQVAILSGVHDGDAVVTAGQIKLRPGAKVIINNAVQPQDQASPTPREG